MNKMKCSKCGIELEESELDLSHDIPKYAGGSDIDGRHYLCKNCHNNYELEVLKVMLMNLIKDKFPEHWRESCRNSANLVRRYYFKNKEE